MGEECRGSGVPIAPISHGMPARMETKRGSMSDNVVQFPKQATIDLVTSLGDKLRLVGNCERVLIQAVNQMRVLGAEDRVIARVLRHAADVLDGKIFQQTR